MEFCMPLEEFFPKMLVQSYLLKMSELYVVKLVVQRCGHMEAVLLAEADPPRKEIYNCYRTKNTPGPYPCFHCGKKFNNYFLYRKHAYICRKTIDVPFPKTCDTCGIRIRSAAHHALHIRKATYCRPKPFTCGSCGKIFKNIHKLILHEKRKTPCTKYFNSAMAKTRVKKAPPALPISESEEIPTSQPPRPPPPNSTCDKCGRRLPNSYILRRHQMSNNCTGNINRTVPKPQHQTFHRRLHASTTFRTRQILKKYKKNYFHAPKLISRFGQSFPSARPLGQPSLPKCPSPVFSSSMLMAEAYEHWPGLKQSRTAECFCPFCQKRFLYLRSRNRHVQKEHSDNPAQVKRYLEQTTCQFCTRLFPTEQSKQSHIQMEHTGVSATTAVPTPEKPFPLLVYPNTRKRNRPAVPITPQLEVQLKKYPNTCAICGKQYCNTFVRDRHLKSHTLEKPFNCSWCPAKFMRSEQLTQHMQVKHDEVLSFQCKACGLKFPTRVRTSQHISKIHREADRDSLMLELKKPKASLPPVCKQEEEDKKELVLPQAHQSKLNGFVACRKDDEPGKGLYSCTLCDIGTFSKMTTLRRHLKSKPHRDRMMELGFTVKNEEIQEEVKEEATAPEEIKEEEMRYTCSVCQTQFSTAARFIPHRLNHLNASSSSETFECEICSQVLSQAEKIQTHLLSHIKKERTLSAAAKPAARPVTPVCATTKPYACAKCHLGFTTKQHLTTHTRRYCAVKVTCPKCNQNFSSMRRYGIHKTQCRPSNCQYCSLEVGPGPELAWHEKSCLKVHQSPEDPVLGRLRTNFSRLFFMLVGDPELMATLGWGKRPLEAVLADVLRHLDREPQARSPGHDPLALLRADITTLLQASLQEHVLDGISCVDTLVEKLLEMSESDNKSS